MIAKQANAARREMHPVFATILKRLFFGLVTLFIVSVIMFTSIQMLPGDLGEAILGQAATDETVAAFRKELGLDKVLSD